MGVVRPRRRVVVAGVSLVAAVTAATVWMLAQGTRGAELANVLGWPVAVAGVLVALVVAWSGSDSTDRLLLASRRLPPRERSVVSSSRPIPRPEVPGGGPLRQLKELLHALYVEAGTPT